MKHLFKQIYQFKKGKAIRQWETVLTTLRTLGITTDLVPPSTTKGY